MARGCGFGGNSRLVNKVLRHFCEDTARFYRWHCSIVRHSTMSVDIINWHLK